MPRENERCLTVQISIARRSLNASNSVKTLTLTLFTRYIRTVRSFFRTYIQTFMQRTEANGNNFDCDSVV